ncbi:MAG: hypothetical protein OCD02_02440 [Spirochaetaceae bacterium]
MFKLFDRGLSKEEIAKTLKKIRKEYNDYIVSYLKPSRAKDEFENRYFFAAKYRENMAVFFKNEILIVMELVKIEEDKIALKEKDRDLANKRRERSKNGDYADKVLKEYSERIKMYPEVKITDDASPEVRKLYGSLKIFEDRYWNSISRYIKTATPEGRMVDHLENDLWLLVGTKSRNPPVLDKYIFLLERPEQDLKAISIAEQACMKQVAFFLNDLLDLYRRSILDSIPPGSAVDGYNYISQVVYNFRLADLKKG